jgi:hypothetical protein
MLKYKEFLLEESGDKKDISQIVAISVNVILCIFSLDQEILKISTRGSNPKSKYNDREFFYINIWYPQNITFRINFVINIANTVHLDVYYEKDLKITNLGHAKLSNGMLEMSDLQTLLKSVQEHVKNSHVSGETSIIQAALDSATEDEKESLEKFKKCEPVVKFLHDHRGKITGKKYDV